MRVCSRGGYNARVELSRNRRPARQAKAIAAVVAVHVALAVRHPDRSQRAHGRPGRRAAEDVRHPPAAAAAAGPAAAEPAPQPQARRSRRARGEESRSRRRSLRRSRSCPSRRRSRRPRSPAPAARRRSGAGTSGSGTGAGGVGQRPGRRRRLSRASRRRGASPGSPTANIAGSPRPGIDSGSVGVTVRVNPDGSVSNCRVARSSGDGSIDGLMCQLTAALHPVQPGARPLTAGRSRRTSPSSPIGGGPSAGWPALPPAGVPLLLVAASRAASRP